MPRIKPRHPTSGHIMTRQVMTIVERIIHIEAMSGVVLLIAAAAALLWANSSYYESYEALWHLPVSFSLGRAGFSQDLHFIVNDVLMTVFFLVAGMEIRREIHDGALADLRQAVLPIIAAIGGVCAPALIYIAFNLDPARHHGWAIPTATDIAFAVGILALLGKAIPANVRIVLLSLAIIDDIIAVLIIALFYSAGIDPSGLLIAGGGIFLVLMMRWLGFASAWTYCLPAAVLWLGLFKTGVHPSLAGVVLGLLTPVLPARAYTAPLERITRALQKIGKRPVHENAVSHKVAQALREIHKGQRDMIPPVTRVQMTLHPWVAFVIMPVFAFANAGVRFGDVDLAAGGSLFVMSGVALGLIAGKPLGVMVAGFLAVQLGLCRLPPQVSWAGMMLVGLLAGIGFTMAIFVAMLAFDNAAALSAAKIGVLIGSAVSGLLGLGYGLLYVRWLKPGRQ